VLKYSRLGRGDVVALLALVGCALVLFRLTIFEGWTFVGDSDRANTFLNIRLIEVTAIQQRGSVPTWNEGQFMGGSLAGLHWMIPGASPFPYLTALFPREDAFRVSDAISIGLWILSLWAAYLYLRAYAPGPIAPAVGALLYGTSAYAVHRIAQVDASFTVQIFIPILMVLVRGTCRKTAPAAFLALAACWAMLALFTFLQEVAYVVLLFAAYSLYRSVRTRDPWPLLVAGLAGAVGILIGLPRLLTVAAEFQEMARTSTDLRTMDVEALRFFGDGLLGRSFAEQRDVLGGDLNLHEGIQMLGSALAALAVIGAGLAAHSTALRVLAVALIAVLSVGIGPYAQGLYGLIWTPDGYISYQLTVVLVNAIVICVPFWLLTRYLSRRRAQTATAQSGVCKSSTPEATAAATSDAPFFLGLVVAVIFLILVPEGHVALYYAFFGVDFTHARLSIIALLPLSALATIFLSRFLPARLTSNAARWLAGGCVVGLLLWLGHEWAANTSTAAIGPVLNTPKWHLLTVEVARDIGSLFIWVAALAILLLRARPSIRTLAAGVLTIWIVLEAGSAADFKLNGPPTLDPAYPFTGYGYLSTSPGTLRVPSTAELAAMRQRLETDDYRAVVWQDKTSFQALVEPYLAAFWDLRLVEGYSSGLPKRLDLLPWPSGVATTRNLDFSNSGTQSSDPTIPDPIRAVPWHLLAALNVKYLLVVDRAFWFNPGPGGSTPPLDLAHLDLIENPYPVTPRVFFAARVTPSASPLLFPGDDGTRPVLADPPIDDPAQHSTAEGLAAERAFSTEGAPQATFADDRIVVRVEPAQEDRFLVLNELYHPGWRAWIDGKPVPIYPTNVVMRGIVVPAGATTVELRFVPLLASWTGVAVYAFGIALAAGLWWVLRRGWLDRLLAPGRSRIRGNGTATRSTI
jgi:hypothetical protein